TRRAGGVAVPGPTGVPARSGWRAARRGAGSSRRGVGSATCCCGPCRRAWFPPVDPPPRSSVQFIHRGARITGNGEGPMKLLLTNDDGIDAPGLRALFDAAVRLGQPVVVAPVEAHSGCSHRVTTHAPLRVSLRSPGRFAVDGT